MKTWMIKLTVALAFATLLVGSPVRAQLDNNGCTDATLKGDYTFTVSGTFWTGSDNSNAVQRAGIALTHFDGAGNLSQVDYVRSSPNAPVIPFIPPSDPLTGFHNGETGAYKVFEDCTGNFTIKNPDFLGTTIPGPVITVNFVISDQGRAIHTVVTSLFANGAYLPVLIQSEGHKVGPILNWWD